MVRPRRSPRPSQVVLALLFASFASACALTGPAGAPPPGARDETAPRLSPEAGAYLDSAVAVMRRDAVHRAELDFAAIADSVRAFAAGAQTVEDTYPALKRALPLLQDHHSSFWTAAEVRDNFGFTPEDIETIKAGTAPQIDPSKVDSLRASLDYASGRVIDGLAGERVGYLVVPEFDNLFEEGMALFADSLQSLIRSLDRDGVAGWVVDLRANRGGNVVPMVVGLGPLLDTDNVYYTVDAGGTEMSASYYRDGGYYSVEAGGEEGEPLIRSSVGYRLSVPDRPVAVLTAWKTASSAEAVTALFAGQPNVAVIGQKTNGLTSVNAFNFLGDDSVLNLTSGYLANRERTVYPQGIAPDIEVPPGEADAASGDAALERAAAWIASGRRANRGMRP